jgi:hypothetical protein
MSGADNSMIKPYPVTEQAKRAMEAKVGDMTLRDYFAGEALFRLAEIMQDVDYQEGITLDIAKQCYKYADAMIKAREL